MTDIENIPLDADDLMMIADRVETLNPTDAEWVTVLFKECMRARMSEADLLTRCHETPSGNSACLDEKLAQVALDTAEWLKILWDVGYMGANSFPSPPRSAFPLVEVEDVLKSALFARIRLGKRPLPFPPPTRKGKPWHELIDSDEIIHNVETELLYDGSELVGINIEECNDWQIISDSHNKTDYVVQHRGKGPLFKLKLEPIHSTLTKEPPRMKCPILRQERAGFITYILQWPGAENKIQEVLLRASTWERADSEANYWIASKHPELYGQVSFEHNDK